MGSWSIPKSTRGLEEEVVHNLILHSSHAPSIVLPGIDSTYHHSLSPPPLPRLMLILLGGEEQLQDGDEVKCLCHSVH
ncbi:hypothetical protein AMTRI_Chr01g104430 [Amborella trichopoda]